MQDREKIFRALLLKSLYPTTKLLIKNLRTNPGLSRLCGWGYVGAATSSVFSAGSGKGRKKSIKTGRQNHRNDDTLKLDYCAEQERSDAFRL